MRNQNRSIPVPLQQAGIYVGSSFSGAVLGVGLGTLMSIAGVVKPDEHAYGNSTAGELLTFAFGLIGAASGFVHAMNVDYKRFKEGAVRATDRGVALLVILSAAELLGVAMLAKVQSGTRNAIGLLVFSALAVAGCFCSNLDNLKDEKSKQYATLVSSGVGTGVDPESNFTNNAV